MSKSPKVFDPMDCFLKAFNENGEYIFPFVIRKQKSELCELLVLVQHMDFLPVQCLECWLDVGVRFVTFLDPNEAMQKISAHTSVKCEAARYKEEFEEILSPFKITWE